MNKEEVKSQIDSNAKRLYDEYCERYNKVSNDYWNQIYLLADIPLIYFIKRIKIKRNIKVIYQKIEKMKMEKKQMEIAYLVSRAIFLYLQI